MYSLTSASNEGRVGLASLIIGVLVLLWIEYSHQPDTLAEGLTFSLAPGSGLQLRPAASAQTAAPSAVRAPTSLAPPREKYERIPVSGGLGEPVEVVWQKPAGAPKGVVLIAHGCSHSAIDWWDKSDLCPTCIGLPEEKRVVAQVLAAGLVPVAISSNDRVMSRCWRPEVDGPRINATLAALLQREGLSELPLFVFGAHALRRATRASSGGNMAAATPLYVPKVKAVGVQIMAVPPAIFSQPVAGGGDYPPVLFMHMPRDEMMAMYVTETVKELRRLGKPPVEEARIEPAAIAPHFFSDRIETVRPEDSERIVAALRSADLLDPSGFLREDPRESPWREALAPLAGGGALGGDSLAADESPLAEELNVAWAAHELASDAVQGALRFFFGAVGGQEGGGERDGGAAGRRVKAGGAERREPTTVAEVLAAGGEADATA